MIKIDYKLFIRRRSWLGWYYSTADMKFFAAGTWQFNWTWGNQPATEDLIATPWHNCYLRSHA